MPLKLVQRKGSDCWYMRGTIRGESIFETTGTGDRRKAEEIRAKTEARLLDESIHGKKHTVTFAEAADSFIAAGGGKRFLYEQRPSGEAFGVAVVLGQHRLAEITQEVLDRAAAKMYPTAQPETKLRQFYTPFRAVWNFAATEKLAEVRKWRLPKKPKGTNVVRIKKERSGSAPTSYEHAAKFVAAMSPAPAMVMTALFFTGMRPIELFALTADDIDVKGRWIVIQKSKIGEPRGVPMHEFLVGLFESLLKRNSLAEDPRIFRAPRGEPYPIKENEGGQLKTAINGARRRSKIKDVSPYTGRHTVSTQLVINGVHPYIKDQILGHAADDMSRHYTNIPQKPLIDAINTIEVTPGWKALEWLEDPLGWSSKLAGNQGKRTDLEKKRA